MVHIIAITGPSGIGKTFLKQKLLETNIFINIRLTTTRKTRSSEFDKNDYNFTTNLDFETNIENYIGVSNFSNTYYGFDKQYVSENLNSDKYGICVCSLYIVLNLNFEKIKLQTFFLYPSDLNLIKSRFIKRGDSEFEINKRINGLHDELNIYEKHKNLVHTINIIDDDLTKIIPEILNKI